VSLSRHQIQLLRAISGRTFDFYELLGSNHPTCKWFQRQMDRRKMSRWALAEEMLQEYANEESKK
jgi:hypothetical protein